MKCSISICLIFIATMQLTHQNQLAAKLTQAYFEKHKDLRKECLAKMHVDETVDYNYEINGDIANDENLGCFLKCVLLKENIINEAGDLSIVNIQTIAKLPREDILNGLMENCSHFDKVDLCKGLLDFANCYVDYFGSGISQ